jgi:NMD protein affecting ribosome stability and mRNA decay
MWGMMSAHTNCPNCGRKGWEEKKDYECRKCGFKKTDTKELPPIHLIYCDGCGCTLSDFCERHPLEKQRLVKLSGTKP